MMMMAAMEEMLSNLKPVCDILLKELVDTRTHISFQSSARAKILAWVTDFHSTYSVVHSVYKHKCKYKMKNNTNTIDRMGHCFAQLHATCFSVNIVIVSPNTKYRTNTGEKKSPVRVK